MAVHVPGCWLATASLCSQAHTQIPAADTPQHAGSEAPHSSEGATLGPARQGQAPQNPPTQPCGGSEAQLPQSECVTCWREAGAPTLFIYYTLHLLRNPVATKSYL